ncbi:aldo/keto reductase [Clostridiales bacterium COT073_COT-073]|nr:aldo/keto reductase [Clostridiales bacterium COT073_COT-073]
MIYKKVKRVEEEISALGVGCWNFGGDWDSVNDEKAEKIVNEAIALGINFFDVAPVYGWGHAENTLGRALKKNGMRHQVLIATKAGLIWDDMHHITNDLSRSNLLKEVDQSLKRLQTDYIDIYQMHWPDGHTEIEEIAETLSEIKKAGKIRYVGLSNFNQADMEKIMTYISVDCQQNLYNMLERNTASYHGIKLDYKTEKEVLPNVKKLGQVFLPYSPMFQGLLAGKFNNGIDFSEKDIRNANPKFFGEKFFLYRDAARQLEKLAENYQKRLSELALNWLIQKDEVTSVIGGVSDVLQLRENTHCLEWKISREMEKEIEEIISPFENI